jgi:tripartite-type tricarboxylate transporter receptor subunit TctC
MNRDVVRRLLGRVFRSLATGFALAPALAGTSAIAQDYPSRPVRFVVGYPAGGSNDTVARIVGQRLAEIWGQNVVVDNRAGAGGTIGADQVVKAQPDGYTLFVGDFGPNVVAGSLYAKLPYDPATDFAHVTQIVSFPLVLLVPAGSPAKTAKDLIEQAKARPGVIKYSSSGVGTSPHLFIEKMNLMANISTLAVHYKGGAPALVGLIGAEVDYTMVSVSTALAQLTTGKIRALAVTSAQASRRLPNVPPLSSVVPGYEAISLHGLHAPAQTPRAIVTKLYQDIGQVLRRPDVKERFDAIAMDIAGTSPEEFTAFIRKQIETWNAVARAANVRAD